MHIPSPLISTPPPHLPCSFSLTVRESSYRRIMGLRCLVKGRAQSKTPEDANSHTAAQRATTATTTTTKKRRTWSMERGPCTKAQGPGRGRRLSLSEVSSFIECPTNAGEWQVTALEYIFHVTVLCSSIKNVQLKLKNRQCFFSPVVIKS